MANIKTERLARGGLIEEEVLNLLKVSRVVMSVAYNTYKDCQPIGSFLR